MKAFGTQKAEKRALQDRHAALIAELQTTVSGIGLAQEARLAEAGQAMARQAGLAPALGRPGRHSARDRDVARAGRAQEAGAVVLGVGATLQAEPAVGAEPEDMDGAMQQVTPMDFGARGAAHGEFAIGVKGALSACGAGENGRGVATPKNLDPHVHLGGIAQAPRTQLDLAKTIAVGEQCGVIIGTARHVRPMALMHLGARRGLKVEHRQRLFRAFNHAHAVAHDAGKTAGADVLGNTVVLQESRNATHRSHVRAGGQKFKKLAAGVQGRTVGHGGITSQSKR